MRRLSVQLVASHVIVALVGALTTFLIVRLTAPALFDAELRRMGGGGGGMGGGVGSSQSLRGQFASAVNESLLIGSLVGVVVAAVIGVLAARRIIKPLGAVRAVTREMAQGRYDIAAPIPPEREVGELASDVNHLASELAQTETRRVRLLGDVAHEMRTPLTVIDGYVEAMIDDVVPVTPENLMLISDESRKLRRLSDDLSALSKAEEGRVPLRTRQVDAAEVANAAARRLVPQADDAGVTLEIRPADGALPIVADPDQIAQIVTNLVGNALRATEPGGRTVVTPRLVGDQVVVEVSDTGVGLSADNLERVFERFYRVPNHRGGDSGSGIGLTISRRIARDHGGDLVAASPGPGQGATFTLSLPVAGRGLRRTADAGRHR